MWVLKNLRANAAINDCIASVSLSAFKQLPAMCARPTRTLYFSSQGRNQLTGFYCWSFLGLIKTWAKQTPPVTGEKEKNKIKGKNSLKEKKKKVFSCAKCLQETFCGSWDIHLPESGPQWGTEVCQAKGRGRVEKKGIRLYSDCEIIRIIKFPITHVKCFFKSRRAPQKSWLLKKRAKLLEVCTNLTFKLVLIHMKISYYGI